MNLEKNFEYIANEWRVLIDLMIISYARSEANFVEGQVFKAEQLIDMLRNYWGQFLTSYLLQKSEREGA